MDQFANVLERLDVTLEDAESIEGLVARLDLVLGVDASTLQISIATEQFQREFNQLQQSALTQGLTIDRFVRGGQRVFQLRNERGQFVVSGVQQVTQRLARGAG